MLELQCHSVKYALCSFSSNAQFATEKLHYTVNEPPKTLVHHQVKKLQLSSLWRHGYV